MNLLFLLWKFVSLENKALLIMFSTSIWQEPASEVLPCRERKTAMA